MEDHTKILEWIKLPITIFRDFSVLYQLLSLTFVFSNLNNKYVAALIFFFLGILLYCPIITYNQIRLRYEKRINELSFDFNGAWKNCLYLDSLTPQDCRVCDNRNKDYQCKECGRKVDV